MPENENLRLKNKIESILKSNWKICVPAIFILIILILGNNYKIINEEIFTFTPEEKKDKEIIDYWSQFDRDSVKGIYLTQSTFSNNKKFQELIDLVNRTELNAMVIDIKDGSGVYLNDFVKKRVGELLKQKIYPIARVAVFIDNDFAQIHPQSALKKPDGSFWRDRKGFIWHDPADKDVWNYNAYVAKEALKLGFKEIQWDYVRFPSDGTLSNIVYPNWNEKTPKNEVIKSFFEYTASDIKKLNPNAAISADLFAFSFIAEDDMDIGQIVSDSVDIFDYISPMIYPSHYSPGNFGFQNPAEYPYEVVYKTLETGAKRFFLINGDDLRHKIRPWIQDFDIGANYDANMVRAQMRAIYDFGNHGWLLWNPSNIYTEEALEKNENL